MFFRLPATFVLLATAAVAQPAAPPSDQPQTARFGTSTSGVVVDVVVRDRRGRPVTGLTRDQFEVFEDGVRQTVIAFEPYDATSVPLSVEEAASAARVGAAAAASPRLSEGPAVIALAWDRLEPEARAIAYKAARRLIETKAPGELIGVFLTDLMLYTLQPYTTDLAALSAAVERLGRTATSSANREPSILDTFVGRAQASPTAGASESSHSLVGFPKSVSSPGDEATARIIAMLERMERTYMQSLYETQGRASMLGLLALVDSLGQLPGRKTIFYFCEGLTIPDSQQDRFRRVIDTANRNNVSVYTFDAAGLRVQSAQQQTAREMRELTFAAAGSEASKPDKLTENLETNERLLKMDPAVSLAILADQTGGLLTNNTNALDRAIDRITDDRRHHYLLSYVPTNAALDGAYRQIVVQVKRPDVEVRARRGYRAATDVGHAPVLEYERPALAALTASPAPTAFPIVTRALHTPMPSRPGLTAVLVALNGRSLATARNDDGGYYAEATILARVVDARGRELARASQRFDFTGKAEDRERSMNRGVVFFRTADLPPGRHVVEAAVYDRMSDSSAVVRDAVEVRAPSGRLLAGDLILVARVEPVPADQPGAATHPLVVNGEVYTPSFGEVVSRSTQRQVTFVLPLTTLEAAPDLTASIELRDRGRTIASQQLKIPPPSESGRVLLVGRLPLDDIPLGAYELRVSIGPDVSRATDVRVGP